MVRTANVSMAQIAKEVSAYSSLSTGDVKSAIDNLITVMTTHLHASESVTLDGLGTFRMVMRASGQGVEDAKDVAASQAKLTVRFQPSSTRNSNGTMATRALVTGVKCVRLDRQEVEENASGDAGGSEPIPDQTV